MMVNDIAQNDITDPVSSEFVKRCK